MHWFAGVGYVWLHLAVCVCVCVTFVGKDDSSGGWRCVVVYSGDVGKLFLTMSTGVY